MSLKSVYKEWFSDRGLAVTAATTSVNVSEFPKIIGLCTSPIRETGESFQCWMFPDRKHLDNQEWTGVTDEVYDHYLDGTEQEVLDKFWEEIGSHQVVIASSVWEKFYRQLFEVLAVHSKGTSRPFWRTDLAYLWQVQRETDLDRKGFGLVCTGRGKTRTRGLNLLAEEEEMENKYEHQPLFIQKALLTRDLARIYLGLEE